MICLIDSDVDPELVDIPIPVNDDSMRSIDVIVRELCKAVTDGKEQRLTADTARKDDDADSPAQERRRSRRAQYRASDAGAREEDPPVEASAEPVAPAAPVTPVAPVEPVAPQQAE